MNNVTSTYTYGADGLRRTSTVGGVTTYYVYDGSTMVEEMQKNASNQLQLTATYLTGPRGPECRIDETNQSEGYYLPGHYDANNNWVNPNGSSPFIRGRTAWYVYDGLGSVVGETDFNGNLTASAKYDVYGAKRSGGTGTATSRQGFVGGLGHVTDSETGLIYMRARYYDPNLGRFESEDIGKSGVNWFAYCSDNPASRVDRSGCDDTLASLSVGMDGAITMDGVPGLAALDATLTGQVGDIAMVDVNYIEAAANGRIGFRTMFSAIKAWASGAGITKIYMQAVSGSDEGAALMEKFSGLLQKLGDKGELQANDPYTMIYWMMQNG